MQAPRDLRGADVFVVSETKNLAVFLRRQKEFLFKVTSQLCLGKLFKEQLSVLGIVRGVCTGLATMIAAMPHPALVSCGYTQPRQQRRQPGVYFGRVPPKSEKHVLQNFFSLKIRSQEPPRYCENILLKFLIQNLKRLFVMLSDAPDEQQGIAGICLGRWIGHKRLP
jgi:hypothetical protein